MMNKLKAFQVVLITFALLLSASLLWFIESSANQYAHVNSHWTQYSNTEIKIDESLLSLHTNLGYGGMIHNFKNYVIRGEKKYLDLFKKDVSAILGEVQTLASLQKKSANTVNLLSEIEQIVLEYENKALIAQQMHAKKLSPKEIDAYVKVDDSAAILALKVIDKEIAKRSTLIQSETDDALSQSSSFLSNGRLFVVPVLLLMILLIYYLQRIQSSNTALIEAQSWINTLLDTAPEATICSNAEGQIIRVNQEAEKLFGYSTEEFLKLKIEQLIPDRFSQHHAHRREGYFKQGNVRPMGKNLELQAKLKNGDEIEVAVSLSIAGNNSNKVVISTIRDITQYRQTSRELAYQASHDSLTGLLNRHQFESRLEQSVIATKRYKQTHTLCFLDLDQFKIVNDTSGHAAGDELLRQISSILTSHIRETDILARLGGDEFAILMTNTDIQHAAMKCEEIITLVEDFRFPWEDKNFNIGVSIGIVEINETSTSHEDALKHADIACFAAKDAGRNRVQIYQGDDKQLIQHDNEMRWVSKINHALENDHFYLYVQEIQSANQLIKNLNYEVLLRMRANDGKAIPPGAFLPTAERYNLISKIDYWVIDNTFRWLIEHASEIPTESHFSINLSGRSIGDDLVLRHITDWLDTKLLPASNIHFEVTETMAIANLHKANNFINAVKKYGCGFSLDDFGSGLSSFGYLKTLNVDTLKIDGLFVRDILDDPIDAAMVESINSIGHVMGMKTIAEFVENDEIAAKLIDMGVDYLQGYGIGKPVPISTILDNNS